MYRGGVDGTCSTGASDDASARARHPYACSLQQRLRIRNRRHDLPFPHSFPLVAIFEKPIHSQEGQSPGNRTADQTNQHQLLERLGVIMRQRLAPTVSEHHVDSQQTYPSSPHDIFAATFAISFSLRLLTNCAILFSR